jgi:hypothetical protein
MIARRNLLFPRERAMGFEPITVAHAKEFGPFNWEFKPERRVKEPLWSGLLAHYRLGRGRTDLAAMQTNFCDPARGICIGRATIDMMVFDATTRTAHLSRGPEYGVA